MKAKILIATFIISGILGCTKNQYTTAPQLTFLSVSTNVVPLDQSIIFNLEFTDREGDIQDTLLVQKRTFNCIADTFNAYYQIPVDVPDQNNIRGEIAVGYTHGINLQYPDIGDPTCVGDDTCIFKFVLKDKAGNISDTAVSPQIVIIKR